MDSETSTPPGVRNDWPIKLARWFMLSLLVGFVALVGASIAREKTKPPSFADRTRDKSAEYDRRDTEAHRKNVADCAERAERMLPGGVAAALAKVQILADCAKTEADR